MSEKIMLTKLLIQRDQLVIEAISRTLGHTSWEYDSIMHRGGWVEYPDGQLVFKFDGEEKLLFHPPHYLDTGEMGQAVEFLYDKSVWPSDGS